MYIFLGVDSIARNSPRTPQSSSLEGEMHGVPFASWEPSMFVNIVLRCKHYGYVIMGAMASLNTRLAIVYSIVYSGADQRNIKAPRHWRHNLFCRLGVGSFQSRLVGVVSVRFYRLDAVSVGFYRFDAVSGRFCRFGAVLDWSCRSGAVSGRSCRSVAVSGRLSGYYMVVTLGTCVTIP